MLRKRNNTSLEKREKQKTSYKSVLWQPCKYLCSQARLRLTAEDIVAGGTGNVAIPLPSTLTQYSSSSLALLLPVSSRLQTTHVYSLLTSDCLKRGSREPRRPLWWHYHKCTMASSQEAFVCWQKWEAMNADVGVSCLEKLLASLFAWL